MTVNQAFRYELDPTVRQQRLLARAAGTARYAFNWGLALCRRLLNAGKPVPHAAELHRRWNAEKAQRSWVYGVSPCCGQEALRDLDRAFANFWRGRKEGRRVGYPRFRRKHGRRDSFRLTGSSKVHPRSVLPRVGCVRTKETTEKFRGRILSATVSRKADGWYVSLAVEVERPQPVAGPVVGIDLGLKSFAVLSGGSESESPKFLARAQLRLRQRQRLHSRKQRGLAPPPHPLSSRGLPAQDDHWPGANQVGHRGRRPFRARPDPPSAPFTGHCGCGVGRVSTDAGVQDRMVWVSADRRPSL